MNTLTVTNNFTFNGFNFCLKGMHLQKFAPQSKLSFNLWLDNHAINITSKFGLRDAIDFLIKDIEVRRIRELYYSSRKNLTIDQILSHSDFAYARYKGEYYNLYLKDKYSPSGVSLAGSCTIDQWERLSKVYNVANNYLSPSEKY